jgi:hypothetical protein
MKGSTSNLSIDSFNLLFKEDLIYFQNLQSQFDKNWFDLFHPLLTSSIEEHALILLLNHLHNLPIQQLIQSQLGKDIVQIAFSLYFPQQQHAQRPAATTLSSLSSSGFSTSSSSASTTGRRLTARQRTLKSVQPGSLKIAQSDVSKSSTSSFGTIPLDEIRYKDDRLSKQESTNYLQSLTSKKRNGLRGIFIAALVREILSHNYPFQTITTSSASTQPLLSAGRQGGNELLREMLFQEYSSFPTIYENAMQLSKELLPSSLVSSFGEQSKKINPSTSLSSFTSSSSKQSTSVMSISEHIEGDGQLDRAAYLEANPTATTTAAVSLSIMQQYFDSDIDHLDPQEKLYILRFIRVTNILHSHINLPAKGNKDIYLKVGGYLQDLASFSPSYITGGCNRPDTQRRVNLYHHITGIHKRYRSPSAIIVAKADSVDDFGTIEETSQSISRASTTSSNRRRYVVYGPKRPRGRPRKIQQQVFADAKFDGHADVGLNERDTTSSSQLELSKPPGLEAELETEDGMFATFFSNLSSPDRYASEAPIGFSAAKDAEGLEEEGFGLIDTSDSEEN